MHDLKLFIKDIYKSFLDEFSSIKLAITILVFLAITTLIGTILPEEPMLGTEALIQKYGEEKYRIYKSFGLTDVFHSWWYLSLLTIFALNLTIASFRRVFPKWKNGFSWPQKIKPETIEKLQVSAKIDNEKNKSLSELQETLSKKNYKVKVENGTLLAVKGGWHRLGASVTHVGIMILIVGATISLVTGFNGMVQLSKDEGFYLADLGQSTNQVKSSEENNWLAPITKMPIWFGSIPRNLIRVNSTWKELHDNGQPKQWHSDLSVLDKNKNEIYRKTIHVNDPLQFMGLDVYQSNWGRFLEVGFNDEATTIPLEVVDGEEIVLLPLSNDIALKLKVLENDSLGSPKLEVYSIFIANQIKEKLIGEIGLKQKLEIGPMTLTFLGAQTLTGLQFKSNPGDILIYPGLIFMMLGVLIAFGAKKELWLTLNPSDNKIIIGGKADRMKSQFVEEFKLLVYELHSK